MTATQRELPVKKISIPPIYTTVPKYVAYGVPPRYTGALPSPVGIGAPWPSEPELPYVLYHVESPHWRGEIKVRKILLDEFGEERAVPFTVWGYLLKEHGDEFEPLFARYGRHEVRKEFIDSVRYSRLAARVGEEAR